MTLDLDKILRHEVYIQRLASGELNSAVYPSLAETMKAVKAILAQHDIVPNITELNKITRAITEEINSQKGWATLTTSLQSVATYEAAFQASVLTEAFAHKMNIPSDTSVLRYINKSIMSLESGSRVDAGIWSQYVKANVDNQANTINKIVINAYGQGKALNSITKDIQTAFDGVIKREAESLARTGFAHYTAQANEAMIQDNKDILSDYYYVVVFDSRLSDVCRNLDLRYNAPGKRFSVGDKSAPFPPLHYRCRTRRIATPKDWEPQGLKASVGAREGGKDAFLSRKERAGGKVVKYRGRNDKAFKGKQIKASTGYEAWLKSQPKWFITETLGKTRSDLFTSGKYSLKSFTDLTGRTLTLDELMVKGG